MMHLCVSILQRGGGGVIGAVKPIEGVSGFLKNYSASPKLDGIIDGLGTEWIHTATAIKPYPGCRFTHAAIDLAARWRKTKPCGVHSFHVWLPKGSIRGVGIPVPNKLHPKTIVHAQFSAYYQLAVAWLDGNETGWAVYNRLNDKDVYELLDRITIDVGEDLPPMSTKLEIRWKDGTTDTDFVAEPLGELSNPFTWEHLLKKIQINVNPGLWTGKNRTDYTACRKARRLEESQGTHGSFSLSSLDGIILGEERHWGHYAS